MKSSPQVFQESDNLDEDGNYLNHTLGEEQEKLNDELLQNYYGKLNRYRDERKHLESELSSIKKRQKESAIRFEDLKRKSILSEPFVAAPRIRSESYTRKDFARSPVDWNSKDDVSFTIGGKDAKVVEAYQSDRKHSLDLLDPQFPGGDELIQLESDSKDSFSPIGKPNDSDAHSLATGKSWDGRAIENSSPFNDDSSDRSGILTITADVYEFRVFSTPKPHVKYLIRVSEMPENPRNVNSPVTANGESASNKTNTSVSPALRRYYDIRRRYSEFKKLHTDIKKRNKSGRILPKLPKSGLMRSFDPFYLQNKALELNKYLRLLIELFREGNITERTPLVSFLAARDEDLEDEDMVAFDDRSRFDAKRNKNISENSRKVHHSLGWSGFHVPLVLGKRPAPGKLVDPGLA